MPGQFIPVFTSSAPTPLPQFSQAVVYNGLVYCSGNIGIKPGAAFELVEGTAKDRTVNHIPPTLCYLHHAAHLRQILTNIRAVLEAARSSLDNVLKMNIFLTNMDNFGIVNEAYDEFFTQAIKPARTCVAVYQLPFGTDVEIECTAHLERQ
ncbi:Endoribonuclease L-PSP/chorismate mutase-like protein [Aspergillus heterothallicus]